MSSPFVYTYRQFPTDDPHNLEKQLVNVAIQYGVAINQRTIGTFDLAVVPDGERWFAAGNTKLRDGQRLVVQVSDANLIVNHGINMINQVTRLYGAFFDGAFWQPLPYVDVLAATNQIGLKVSATQIIVTKGAGAPSISSGVVVLEFL
jgi:hypothetical protein